MNDTLQAEMIEVMAQHLNFLEGWSNISPFEIAGVAVPRLFTYELIQVLNNAWLGHALTEAAKGNPDAPAN